MTTSGRLTQPTLPGLTWFAAASPASPTASPAFVAPRPMNATFGASLPESFAKLGPAGSWLRMCQGYSVLRLDGSSDEFSGTWPRSGLMRSGSCFPLQPSALPTDGSGFSSLPTPTATSYGRNKSPSSGAAERLSLQAMASRGMWPTPTANDSKNASCPPSHASRDSLVGAVMRTWATPTVNGNHNRKGASPTSGDGLATQAGGPLNPTWVEWLMGFPLGWTDLEPSETP